MGNEKKETAQGQLSEEGPLKPKTAAIILAAGQGKRMQSRIQKQYMTILGKPVLYYALKAFEESCVDHIIVVVGAGEVEYCRTQIVENFHFTKVRDVVEGGKERYHSVYEGLMKAGDCDYVFIHDGARPLVDTDMIKRALETVVHWNACVVGMPVKDTIKIADADNFCQQTPDRSRVWAVQTPQAFSFPLVFEAYSRLFEKEEYQKGITDDAMVVETMTGNRVKLIEGSYENIKITTPEDLVTAELLLKRRKSAV